MKQYTRKAIFSELKPFCHFAGDDDFIEITEWYSGEGYDVNISSKNRSEQFSLTDGELQALLHLMNAPK